MDRFIHEKTIVVDREKDNEDDKKDEDIPNIEFSLSNPLSDKELELKKKFDNWEYEEFLNYINLCGDYTIKTPVKIKMDIFDVMGEDIMILVKDSEMNDEEESYRETNKVHKNKEKINYKEQIMK